MPSINYYYVGNCEPNFFTECKIAYWLWRIFPGILLVIGTCGNLMNIVILTRKQLRKYSTTVFLLILAVTELVLLWTSLVPDTALSITGHRIEDSYSAVCKVRYWILLTAGSYSTWLLVFLTLERTLLTKVPVLSRRKVNPRSCLTVSITALILIALANSHMIYGTKFYDNLNSANLTTNSSYDADYLQFRCYFVSDEYELFVRNYWNVFVLSMYNVVPALIIIAGNVNIVAVLFLRKNGITTRVHPVTNPAEVSRRKASTKLLFTLSVFYFITTTPWCVYIVLRRRVTSLAEIGDQGFARWQLGTVTVNILLWSNFSFNFFFYFMSGTLFKREWKRLVEIVNSSIQRQS